MAILTTVTGQRIDEVISITGDKAVLNITAPTVLKVGPGRVGLVSTLAWGTAAGAIYDSASTTGNAAANQIGVTATNAFATTEFNFPFTTGLVIVPGTGQALSVSFL